MIPAVPIARQTPAWQRELAESITDPVDLVAALGLPRELGERARPAAARFGLRVTRSFLARMRYGDPADPLLRQVLPLEAELDEVPGYGPDPLAEAGARRAPGLLQKYAGRALLITTEACAIHCRYCFRREFPYDEHASDAGRWSAAIAQLAADPTVEEVILSGGDPLSLSDARLEQLATALEALPHLRSLRLHTRQPIVLPSRVDEGLMQWLRVRKLPLVMVLHANHPQEIDAQVAGALQRLRAGGALLLNQSVLLRGVNDDPAVLAALSRALLEAGALPYYLHLPDPVRGSAHFQVTQDQGCRIVDALARSLPGYLVPRLVREVPGEAAKRVLAAGIHGTY